jgi:DNA-binding MurR/RpiR family transcriptional regulator
MVSARKKNAPDVFRGRLRVSALSPTAARVARFIDQHRATAIASSAAKLAARTGTSDATVVRTVQALGFEGLPELKEALAAGLEQRSTPADHMKKTLAKVGEDSSRAIDNVFDTHRQALNEPGSAKVKARIAIAISRLHGARRIVVFGIGPSGPLAHHVTILLSRNGRRARALDATGRSLADQLLDLNERDALLVLSYGYREVIATFQRRTRCNCRSSL